MQSNYDQRFQQKPEPLTQSMNRNNLFFRNLGANLNESRTVDVIDNSR